MECLISLFILFDAIFFIEAKGEHVLNFNLLKPDHVGVIISNMTEYLKNR